MSDPVDMKPLEDVIVGRVEPRIYAFLTTSVPRYLKVGDTYRPVPVRIAEWQRHFPIDETRDVWDWPAVLDDKVFFRDYSVHQYLENSRHLIRLDPQTLKTIAGGKDLYFSNEFFLDARKEHVEEALADIRDDHARASGRYSFYSVKDIGKNAEDEPMPTPVDLKLRPNQEEAVRRFKEAVDANRTNLLMYAVMRFGKTVASLQCALEIGARFVVVVSGKADVAREWRNTVLGFNDFNDEFVFLSRKDLDAKYTRVTEEFAAGHKVVLFATLQDLQGDAVKPRHEQIFSNKIDLLIIDETHFAARAEEYGKALRVPKKYEVADTEEEAGAEEAAKAVKALDAQVRLHLSGTPYRILMGSEFEKKDIVSFCQFTDILDAQRKWNEENLGRDEWDNPYYGFPQMVRFAFNLNESARKKLKELEAGGKSAGFRELFRPMSTEKDTSAKQLHRKFVHEQEVVDLLRAIGGAADEPGILPFLKYEKIEKGQMCRHIVCVLPYCASCDALEALLDARNRKYKGTFGKLGEYKVVNISGTEVKKGFVKIADVVKTIADCEKRGEKTLTLTVNRMLTGSTVPEWDTMLFLKDTSSPQEYDQAIFRLQSSFVRDMADGNGRKIRYNMKPQTLLVDFDPARMFLLQANRAQAYNVNTDKNGNLELEKRVARELDVSPVILFNKDKIHRVEASDIMAEISRYSSTRGVAEEVEDVPVDRSVQNDPTLCKFIDGLPEHGSKEGLTLKPHTGEETDADTGDAGTGDGEGEGGGNAGEAAASASGDSEEQKKRDRRIKTLHSLIVFYSFLVPERVRSLDEILQIIDKNEDNQRIARHLDLGKDVLKRYRDKVGWQTLQALDYKIQNLDRLANETQNIDLGPEYKDTPEAVKKAIVAMRKFGRLGESKIVTPPNIAYDMVRQIPGEELKALLVAGEKVLDPASKMGEFAIALVRRCAEADIGLTADDLKDAILSIPMCGVTYEFTRKVYELLGLDVKCIALPEKMTAYDLLKIKAADGKTLDYPRIKRLLTQNKDFNTISIGDDVAGEDNSMCKKIGLVISNPPYQEDDGGFASSASPVYNLLVDAATSFRPHFSSFITPARWFVGGKGLDDFRMRMLSDHHICSLVDFPLLYEPFSNVKIRGGISYFLRDGNYNGPCSVQTMKSGKPVGELDERYLDEFDVLVRRNEAVPILRKVNAKKEDTIDSMISSRKPFGLPTNFKGEQSAAGLSNPVSVYAFQQKIWVDRSTITTNAKWIDEWKVLMTAVQGTSAAEETRFLSNPIVAEPGTVCTETYLVAGHFTAKSKAKNLANYLRTRFVRFLVSLRKATQHATRDVYAFVPLQDFTASSDIDWSRPVPEIDKQLYDKYGLTDPERQFIESMIKPME